MENVRCRVTWGCTSLLLALLAALAGIAASWTSEQAHDTARRPARGDSRQAHLSATYARIPLHFEANGGQTDERVKFMTRGRGYTMFFTANEAVLVLSRSQARDRSDRLLLRPRPEPRRDVKRTVLRMTFPGANPKPRVEGRDELPGEANYFKGNDPARWRASIPTYARVQYTDVFSGIDLVYYGNQRELEYDFVVRPGADPSRIALGYEGADRIEIDAHGDLVLHTANGAIRQRRPFIYQEVDGARREIAGGYVARDDGSIGFHVAAYEASRPLVIDPAVLFYSTYLGGSAIDLGSAIAVDASGNAYVTGSTASTDFPTTAGAFQTSFGGGDDDAFVARLNPTGSGLVYSTYIGGGSFESGAAIAVDGFGNAYVTGPTSSTDFPTTLGASDTTFNGGLEDAFVAKLDSTGSALVYSTYLGGGDDDFASAIAVDTAGSAYVGGTTASMDFPTTLGAFETTFNSGFQDGFVAKLATTGSALLYSTYLGGSGDDSVAKIALDAAANAVVTGASDSINYPTTLGAFDTTSNGDFDAVVTKLNALGTGLLYSTFLGGSALDSGNGIAIDSAGAAYVGGITQSTGFPTTPGAFQITPAGGFDLFVTKLNSAGSGIVYSTFLGGSGNDFGGSLAVDAAGSAYATGATFSNDFPTRPADFQQTFAGDFDAFITKVDAAGSALMYSSYLGGSGGDSGQGVALDAFPVPNAHVVGLTTSTDFPTTPGAFQGTFAGTFDGFVTKVAEGNPQAGPFTARVSGGGTIDVPGGIASFSFMIRRSSSGALSGRLQYFNHASGAKVRSESYDSLVIAGNTATFDGICTVDGVPCTFTVNVTDNGEPGTTDTFTISVSGGPTEGGVLRSGNVLISEQ